MAHKLEHKNSKIELLSPKQNGSTVEERDGATNKHNKQSIKTMWKNAFKSLKTDKKDKNRGERGDWERDKDREKDDRSEKYSKQSPSGSGSRQSSIKRLLGSRQGSKKNLMRQDSDDYDTQYTDQEPHHRPSLRRMLSSAKSPSISEVPEDLDDVRLIKKHSRQSSIKKGALRRKGSKEDQMEEPETVSGGDPDPIFATLKMASERRSKKDDLDGTSPPLEGAASLDYGAEMIFMRSAVKQTDRYGGKVINAATSPSDSGRAPMLRQQSSQQSSSRDYGM